MTNPFLTNQALENFLQELKINPDQKNLLISKIPQLDEQERTKLLYLLTELYLLDLEKDKSIERIKKFWEEYPKEESSQEENPITS